MSKMLNIIHDIKKKEIAKQRNKQITTEEKQIKHTQNKKWIIFTYHSPLVRKVTYLFKNKGINIAIKANNTIYQQLAQKADNRNPSGIYEIKCYMSSKNYVGQSGRPITIRHREHIRYIKTNNSASAYTTHLLNNKHEYGTANDTLKLIQPCRKSKKMNHWENLYIQTYRQQNLLITEQQVNEPKPLY
jgi:hypothetical protein